ncbi:GntR family transcriptional regulator [Glycomyces sp. L485]|uniref:GntR family transcriptional regulator n=1 Tax=Glycomyces sp. L485 TaxID=2909235 RepID=UPI001F4AD2AE|nr:GntR family transcriptional regulator [Glycomyces sp. L485]MCH7232855.1 GntR family transcriptional regulator [Glycomyces sp. L485]
MGEALVWPERQTLADEAYSELKSRILQSILPPAEKLSIDGLAKRLEISQTPIREALARLEAEGLVERRPLSGYKVTPLLTEDEFEDLFGMRELLEPLAAKRAADPDRSRHDGGVADSLRMLARTPPFDSDRQLSRLDFTEADKRFHNYIGQLSGSPMLAKAIDRLDAHLHLHRSYIEPKMIEETENEHFAIAEAIIDEQPLTAEEAMRRHLENSHARHAAAFRRAEAVVGPKKEVNRTP